MELRQLIYFKEVAKLEHVTEAANAMHVAQSAVSRQIFNLESELGVDLFIREGRNVHLTPIGKLFLKHVENALNVLEEAKREVREYLDPEQGTVQIGFPSSMANYTLPTTISAFREEHPLVKFKFRQGSYHYLIDAVVSGKVDMALIGPVPRNNPKLKGEILFLENIVVLLPVDHPLAERTEIQLNQLRNEGFVLFPPGFGLREIIENACLQQGFTPNVSFEGKDIDGIKGLVSAGLGITLIPEMALSDSIPRGTVKIPIIEPEVTRTVGIIIPSERQLLPTEKIFYEFLKGFFKKLDDYY
ncbi:LysR family transcriptional regulator [Calidifontibacillus oryziterrae]|uniref:LysR family transcriptional regulator n=1 Tax=Calidifontibacillus oryziterrae TaxID=1191699 RepID=UPI0002E08C2A|nr:LysR family transcriptional regulator [Calidifontibacillus oryziterrae]